MLGSRPPSTSVTFFLLFCPTHSVFSLFFLNSLLVFIPDIFPFFLLLMPQIYSSALKSLRPRKDPRGQQLYSHPAKVSHFDSLIFFKKVLPSIFCVGPCRLIPNIESMSKSHWRNSFFLLPNGMKILVERPVRCGSVLKSRFDRKRLPKKVGARYEKRVAVSVVLSVRCVAAGRPALSDGMDSVPPTTKPDALA